MVSRYLIVNLWRKRRERRERRRERRREEREKGDESESERRERKGHRQVIIKLLNQSQIASNASRE